MKSLFICLVAFLSLFVAVFGAEYQFDVEKVIVDENNCLKSFEAIFENINCDSNCFSEVDRFVVKQADDVLFDFNLDVTTPIYQININDPVCDEKNVNFEIYNSGVLVDSGFIDLSEIVDIFEDRVETMTNVSVNLNNGTLENNSNNNLTTTNENETSISFSMPSLNISEKIKSIGLVKIYIGIMILLFLVIFILALYKLSGKSKKRNKKRKINKKNQTKRVNEVEEK